MELKSIDNPFFRKLRRVATTAILRDIKHGARIPISHSYVLVGVADEGPAYESRGKKDVFCLNEGEIFGRQD
jgi:RNA-dependent RNA polymerase